MVNGGGFGSYTNVVKSGIVPDQSKNLKSIVLQESDITNPQSLSPSVFGKVCNVKNIPNWWYYLRKKAFLTFKFNMCVVIIRFMCLLIWKKIFSRFKKSKHVHAYFSTFIPVVNGFIVKERVDWIELMGLPCCAWNDGDVLKVANIWGVCFLEEDSEAPLAMKQVCIKTLKPSLIQDKVKLAVQGIEDIIGVCELSNWQLEIIDSGDSLDSDIPSLLGESDDENCFGENNVDENFPFTHQEGKEIGEIGDGGDPIDLGS